MKNLMCLVSVVMAAFLILSCSGGDEDGNTTSREPAGAGEEKTPCVDRVDCDDQDPCTVDDCYEGFCDNRWDPIDEDLDGHVSHLCGGPDCDDGNETIHPGALEYPHDEEICFDGLDNDCNGSWDEEEAGCFRCETSEDCDDGNPCTKQGCVEGRCAYANNPGPCDDSDPCTVNDTCFGRICTGDPLDADGDAHVAQGCGGDDCDDALPEVHPGASEGPPGDSSCSDGLDNDCDGLTDAGEVGCHEDNTIVELTTNGDVAANETDLEISLAFGTIQQSEEVRISYSGAVDVVYGPTAGRLWVEAMSLSVEPVSTSFSTPFGVLSVDLEAFQVLLQDPRDVPVDPEGRFAANIRLRIETIASADLNGFSVIEDYPMSIVSDSLDFSGRWVPRGDTDANGRSEFDLLASGPVTYTVQQQDIPQLGPVTVTIRGDVELGFRGEEM
jgi:hypothetical protein